MGILDEMAVEEAAEVETPVAPVVEAEENGQPDVEDDGEDEVVVTIGEEHPEEDAEKTAPPWVKDLRRDHRKTVKENIRLQREVEALKTGVTVKPVEVGPKPTLEGCDFDAHKFEGELDAWKERKIKADAARAEVEAETQRQAEEWKKQLDTYAAKKSELKAKDFEDVEASVSSVLSKTQQGLIIQGADNPAVVVLAIGRNPVRLKELAAIKDPVKFAFAVAKLETQMKVSTRRPGTAPESKIQPVGKKHLPADKYDVGGTFE